MSDYFPAEIHVGGPIPGAILPELIRAVCAEGASMDTYDGPQATGDRLQTAIREGAVLDLYDVQAPYGQFDHLEGFLVERGIHFDRHSDAYCEYNAENVYYRGCGEPLVMLADQNGNSLVRCQDVLEILEGRHADDRARLKAVRDLVAPPQVTPLEPIRFV